MPPQTSTFAGRVNPVTGAIETRLPTTNLVLEGGGTRCEVYVSALQELQQAGVLDNLQRVAGSSAGALTATLLAVGYTPQELKQISQQVDYSVLQDKSKQDSLEQDIKEQISPFIAGYEGNVLLDTVRGLVQTKVKNSVLKLMLGADPAKYQKIVTDLKQIGLIKDAPGGHFIFNDTITFNHLAFLKEYYPELGFKDLFITGTNLTDQRAEVFSKDTQGNMEIALGVRISMSIPGMYKEVVYNGKRWTDGGVLKNFPMDVFEAPQYRTEMQALGLTGPNRFTLGLRVDSKEEMQGLLADKKTSEKDFVSELWSTFKEELVTPVKDSLLSAFIGADIYKGDQDAIRITKEYKDQVIQLYDGGHDLTDFNVNAQTRQDYDYYGKQGAQQGLAKLPHQTFASVQEMARQNPQALSGFYRFLTATPAQNIFTASNKTPAQLEQMKASLIKEVGNLLYQPVAIAVQQEKPAPVPVVVQPKMPAPAAVPVVGSSTTILQQLQATHYHSEPSDVKATQRSARSKTPAREISLLLNRLEAEVEDLTTSDGQLKSHLYNQTTSQRLEGHIAQLDALTPRFSSDDHHRADELKTKFTSWIHPVPTHSPEFAKHTPVHSHQEHMEEHQHYSPSMR